MSLANEDVTVTDADRAKAAELIPHAPSCPAFVVMEAPCRCSAHPVRVRTAAALADARAEADQLRDAMRALAEEMAEAGALYFAARVRDLADGGRR